MLAREKFDGPHVCTTEEHARSMLKKSASVHGLWGEKHEDMRERRDAQDGRENHVMHKRRMKF